MILDQFAQTELGDPAQNGTDTRMRRYLMWNLSI